MTKKFDGKFWRTLWRQRALVFMMLPGLVISAMFGLLPRVGFILCFKSFKYSEGIFGSPWTGLANYQFLIADKVTMWRLMRNTMAYWALFNVTGTIVCLFMALMLNECRRRYFVRISHTIMLIPSYIGYVCVTSIVYAFLAPNGLVNTMITYFGGNTISFYESGQYWPLIYTIIYNWKGTGTGCILYTALMAGIDQEMYEAADIDGANKIQQTFHITFPSMYTAITLIWIMGVASIMTSNTGLHYLVNKNSALLANWTQTIDAYTMAGLMGENSLVGNYGVQGAISFFQGTIGTVLTFITNGIVRKIEPANALY